MILAMISTMNKPFKTVRLKTACRILLTAALLLNSLPALAAVTATVNKNTFAPGETIQLSLQSDTPVNWSTVNLSPLEKSFTIVRRNTGTHITATASGQTQLAWLDLWLKARRNGGSVIPSLQVGNAQTAAIAIQIDSSGGQLQPVQIEARWLESGAAYVQSQMTLIVKIRHDGSLQEYALDSPSIADAMVYRLGEDIMDKEDSNGRTWQVIERRFVITPLKSGTLTVPPLLFKGQVGRRTNSIWQSFGQFFGQPFALETLSLEREILPPAANYTGSTWLPAKSLTLSVEPLAKTEFKTGEPINLNISIVAVGLLAGQLPGIQMGALADNIAIYPDDPVLKSVSNGSDVVGTLSLAMVLIPAAAGAIDLPEISVTWWDINRDETQTAVLKLPSLNVVAATVATTVATTVAGDDTALDVDSTPNVALPVAPSAAVDAPLSTSHSFWQWLAIGALGGWLLSTIFLLRRKPAAQQIAPAVADDAAAQQRLLDKIKQHAQANDAAATYAALQKLERIMANGPLQTALDNQGLYQASAQISQLKQHLFAAKHASWDGETAWLALADGLQKLLRHQEKPNQAAGLKPLYPE